MFNCKRIAELERNTDKLMAEVEAIRNLFGITMSVNYDAFIPVSRLIASIPGAAGKTKWVRKGKKVGRKARKQ